MLKPKNKVEIQKVSPIFVFFLFFVCCLQRQEDANELRWGKKKTNGIKYTIGVMKFVIVVSYLDF